jgi:Flp pilus assembly protein TadD
MRGTLILILALTVTGMTSSPVFADASSSPDSRLAPFQKLIDDDKYEMAISELKKALGESPDDADLLNLLAYSQRKLVRFDEALVNYQKALEIEPEHRGANE